MCLLLPVILARGVGGYRHVPPSAKNWQGEWWILVTHRLEPCCPIPGVLSHEGWMVFSAIPGNLRQGIPWLDMWGTEPPTAEGHSSTLGVWTPDQGFSNPQSLNPLYTSTWGVRTPDQGFLSNPSNQLYPMATMLCMWCPRMSRLAKNGWCAQNFGPATKKRKGTQTKQIWFKWIKFSHIVAKRMKYTP